MDHYLFKIKQGIKTDDALRRLQELGLQEIYIIEDEELKEVLIGGYSSQKITSDLGSLVSEKNTIDWENQWSSFAQNFENGHAHIDLSQFGANTHLILAPGEGFGDLSHPTTFLMLKMMKNQVHEQTVLDLGTGSGILSLAAIFLGSRFAVGIDIDSKAVSHAKKNAKLNLLKSKTSFRKTIPKTLSENNVCLMNMLPHEQQMVRPERINPYAKLWIISGVLEEHKTSYLAQTASWGWEIVEEHHRLGWMGWVFQPKKLSQSL